MAARHRTRRATGGAALAPALAAVLAVLAGCGGDSPADTARRAESAAESLASRASEAVESATAEAERRLDDIRDGIDVKDDVRLGAVAVGSDGRARVEVTVRNTDAAARSFAVQVDFTDPGGGLLDTVVVTVHDVPADGSGTVTARSTHDLSGEVRAEVARALRY
ncbi:hypothetical protein [Streptomyces lomondensis]|uniref:Lipoprotein n=1 Tax=Streptomyces lomondensis TaxID=68229 RepID=A0ABQ2XFM3_9ACTN|nr:hypothetical protein [Streptomyces lomondensis]MCF0077511.1 hypothetical protein [Streptomyces lomondensis]GGX14663.1 hypothetical protein GCM10010383_51060 [Streptomyces lomondensis]